MNLNFYSMRGTWHTKYVNYYFSHVKKSITCGKYPVLILQIQLYVQYLYTKSKLFFLKKPFLSSIIWSRYLYTINDIFNKICVLKCLVPRPSWSYDLLCQNICIIKKKWWRRLICNTKFQAENVFAIVQGVNIFSGAKCISTATDTSDTTIDVKVTSRPSSRALSPWATQPARGASRCAGARPNRRPPSTPMWRPWGPCHVERRWGRSPTLPWYICGRQGWSVHTSGRGGNHRDVRHVH